MRPVSLLALAGLVLVAGCGGPEPPPFKPLADNKLLMEAIVDPSADIVWECGEDDRHERRHRGNQAAEPKNEWMAVRNAAVTLAESGNLLMMVPRAKDGGDWMKWSQQMIDTSEAAIRAVEAKNPERLFTVGGDIYESCTNCHRQYVDAIVNANK